MTCVERSIELLPHSSHFGDESLEAITCIGTDNLKEIRKNTQKSHKINQLALGTKNKNPKLNLNQQATSFTGLNVWT